MAEQMYDSGGEGGGVGSWVQDHKGAALGIGFGAVLLVVIAYAMYKKNKNAAASGSSGQTQVAPFNQGSGWDLEQALAEQFAAQNLGAAGQGQNDAAAINAGFSNLQQALQSDFLGLGSTLNQQAFNGQTTPTSSVPQGSAPSPGFVPPDTGPNWNPPPAAPPAGAPVGSTIPTSFLEAPGQPVNLNTATYLGTNSGGGPNYGITPPGWKFDPTRGVAVPA